MKKRMRYYIRQGWTIITLSTNANGELAENYHSIRAWCEKNFNRADWQASLYGMGEGSRFAFKNPADATIFSLRWL